MRNDLNFAIIFRYNFFLINLLSINDVIMIIYLYQQKSQTRLKTNYQNHFRNFIKRFLTNRNSMTIIKYLKLN